MAKMIDTKVFTGIDAIRARLVSPNVRLYEQVEPGGDKYRPLTDLDKAFTMALYDEAVIKGFLPIYDDEPDPGYTGP